MPSPGPGWRRRSFQVGARLDILLFLPASAVRIASGSWWVGVRLDILPVPAPPVGDPPSVDAPTVDVAPAGGSTDSSGRTDV